jgi:hypothetical protein
VRTELTAGGGVPATCLGTYFFAGGFTKAITSAARAAQ